LTSSPQHSSTSARRKYLPRRDPSSSPRAPHDLDDAGKPAVAKALAERLQRAAQQRSLSTPGARLAFAQVDSSDEADCEDLQGQLVNAFITGQRCYRLTVRLASGS
jgi:hypothetical protein